MSGGAAGPAKALAPTAAQAAAEDEQQKKPPQAAAEIKQETADKQKTGTQETGTQKIGDQKIGEQKIGNQKIGEQKTGEDDVQAELAKLRAENEALKATHGSGGGGSVASSSPAALERPAKRRQTDTAQDDEPVMEDWQAEFEGYVVEWGDMDRESKELLRNSAEARASSKKLLTPSSLAD